MSAWKKVTEPNEIGRKIFLLLAKSQKNCQKDFFQIQLNLDMKD
jgi:hypothetical protein